VQAGVALEELADFVTARGGDTCGLATALRSQAYSWRRRAAELEAQPAAG
jgi:hypothetical protein